MYMYVYVYIQACICFIYIWIYGYVNMGKKNICAYIGLFNCIRKYIYKRVN